MPMFLIDGKTYQSIPDFPNYYASEDGYILSLVRGFPHILSAIKDRKPAAGLYVFLYRDGIMYKGWIHRLVLMAWDRKPEEGEECRHLNGNPTDNNRINLKWGTPAENSLDRISHGRSGRGESGPTHKLTEVQVLEIRAIQGHRSLRSLARQYGVSHTAVRREALGINWRHLAHE